MNETYLMINGKKIELTAEQKKALGVVEETKETKETNCFDRVDRLKKYFLFSETGILCESYEEFDPLDNHRYSVANYCTDKDLMHQRAMHETLNRLLWRYSMTHEGDKIDWDDAQTTKHYIAFNKSSESETTYLVDYNNRWKLDGVVYFRTRGLALLAIEEIVKPFIKEHPDFVW